MTARRWVAAVAALLTLTACGVRPTGVVLAGPAPAIADIPSGSGQVQHTLVLYFVVNGRVQPLTRPFKGPDDVGVAIEALLRGPDTEELERKVTTLLPTTTEPVKYSAQVDPTLAVPFALRGLPVQAIAQLACTAVATTQARLSPAKGVFLTGTDGSLGFRQCAAS